MGTIVGYMIGSAKLGDRADSIGSTNGNVSQVRTGSSIEYAFQSVGGLEQSGP